MNAPVIAVLSGGISGEREVSQRSAAALFNALREHADVELFDVGEAAIPKGLNPGRHVVVSALHGVFGEDGEMQTLLEGRGFAFAGSDAVSSRLCMDKTATKRISAAAGVTVPAGLAFSAGSPPDFAALASEFGEDLILKPNGEGSSIGLRFASGEAAYVKALEFLTPGKWIVEQRVSGRELTVGILHGRALGIVEIVPRSGHFDYESKYTKGLTDYRWPADLPDETAREIRRQAEIVFRVCGCRDFARVDFMLSDDGVPFMLEINTIPGLTETSLLPKSALCEGIDFSSLARELAAPAIGRFARIEDEAVR